jgi:hypothetical protein
VTTRLRRLTPLALAAALSTSACGSLHVGAAAVAGDRRISVAQLQQATAEIQDITGGNAEITQGQVLEWLILQPWVVDIATKYGVGVSTDETLQLIGKSNPAYDPNSATEPHKQAAPETVGALRSMLAIRGVGGGLTQDAAQRATDELRARIGATDIDVNPRYMGATPDWLVGAEATPGGSAAGATGDGAGAGGQAPEPTATP